MKKRAGELKNKPLMAAEVKDNHAWRNLWNKDELHDVAKTLGVKTAFKERAFKAAIWQVVNAKAKDLEALRRGSRVNTLSHQTHQRQPRMEELTSLVASHASSALPPFSAPSDRSRPDRKLSPP